MSSNFFSVWGENLHIHEDRSGMGGSSDVFYRSIHVPVHNCRDEGGHWRQGRLKVKQRRARIALRFACWVLSWSSLLGAWSQNDWLLYIRDKTLTYLFRKNWICTGRSLEVHGARSRLPFGFYLASRRSRATLRAHLGNDTPVLNSEINGAKSRSLLIFYMTTSSSQTIHRKWEMWIRVTRLRVPGWIWIVWSRSAVFKPLKQVTSLPGWMSRYQHAYSYIVI